MADTFQQDWTVWGTNALWSGELSLVLSDEPREIAVACDATNDVGEHLWTSVCPKHFQNVERRLSVTIELPSTVDQGAVYHGEFPSTVDHRALGERTSLVAGIFNDDVGISEVGILHDHDSMSPVVASTITVADVAGESILGGGGLA